MIYMDIHDYTKSFIYPWIWMQRSMDTHGSSRMSMTYHREAQTGSSQKDRHTRRRKLRRPSTKCFGKSNGNKCFTEIQSCTFYICFFEIPISDFPFLFPRFCSFFFFPQRLVEGLLNFRRRCVDRSGWIWLFKTAPGKRTNVCGL